MISSRDDGNDVGKYVHADGSETSIKHVSSCDTVRDPATGGLYRNNAARNKFSVFASSSRGCFMRCGMCHLTIKGATYAKGDPVSNILEAIDAEFSERPDMADKYMKLCWMGMGEDHVMAPTEFLVETARLMRAAIGLKTCAGIDGCDIATVLPRRFDRSLGDHLVRLEADLSRLPVNPILSAVHASNGYAAPKRSLVRLFYSLHAATQEKRDVLIPNATPLADAMDFLSGFAATGLDLVFHHLFLDGFNDSRDDVTALIDLLVRHGMQEREVRILRYNPAADAKGVTPFVESRRFAECVAMVTERLPRVKVQISTGVDVLAACGQFVAPVRRGAVLAA